MAVIQPPLNSVQAICVILLHWVCVWASVITLQHFSVLGEGYISVFHALTLKPFSKIPTLTVLESHRGLIIQGLSSDKLFIIDKPEQKSV